MLARTPYLTAQELGIREIEHEYLSRFVSEGEQGKLPEQHTFDMRDWLRASDKATARSKDFMAATFLPSCGTVGCIAGTMELYARQDDRLIDLSYPFYSAITASEPLGDLFYPDIEDEDREIPLEHAVNAVRTFLQTGKVDWPLALGQSA